MRQSILEQNLGWRIVRIWSTDWNRNRSRQIQRVIDAYESALNGADATGANAKNNETTEAPEPIVVERQKLEHDISQSFSNIDEVADDTIQGVACHLLRQIGAIERDDLVRQVARDLGFRRTGKHIRNRIEAVLTDCTRRGLLDIDGNGRLNLAGP